MCHVQSAYQDMQFSPRLNIPAKQTARLQRRACSKRASPEQATESSIVQCELDSTITASKCNIDYALPMAAYPARCKVRSARNETLMRPLWTGPLGFVQCHQHGQAMGRKNGAIQVVNGL